MKNKLEILEPENTYHIFNRANGGEKLFLSDENYRYFLQKYQEYIDPIAETFCYCLMSNHFHFLIRIKSEKALKTFFESRDPKGFKNPSDLLSAQFSNFFNAYSKAFNKQNKRMGSLFMHPFKRKLVNSTEYLVKLVHYIHLNPVESGICKSPADWKHSSFEILLNNSPTFLKRDEIIDWFGDKSNFTFIHETSSLESGIS
jgi:putative transposase